MANEKPKTGIILAVMFGLFGIISACLAITAVDKYRTQKAIVKRLEQKLAAGKQEVIKVPTLQLQTMDAQENEKIMGWDLEEVTEERDELSSECGELKAELIVLKIGEGYYAAEKANLLKTIDAVRERLALVSKAPDKVEALEKENKMLLGKLELAKATQAIAEKSVAEIEAILIERGPKMEVPPPAAPVLVKGDVQKVRRLLADTEKKSAKLEKKLKLLDSKNKKLTDELDTLQEALALAQKEPKTEEETEAEKMASNLKKVIEAASTKLLPSLKEALTDLRAKAESPYTAENVLHKAFKETETRLASIESALKSEKQ